MLLNRISALCAAALLFSLALTAGMGGAQEIQVPVDEAGTLTHIDAELEQELELFPEYGGFREARLFRGTEGEYVLEISYEHEGGLAKVRVPLSAQEVRELRRKVTARIEERAPLALLDRTGRPKLLITTTLLSLGYYGWAVPVVLDVSDGQLAVALYLMTSGAGFFIPRAATEMMPVTDAAATLALYGGTRGIVHGVCLDYLFRGEDVGGRDAIAFGMVASVMEGVAGFCVANRLEMSAGTAEVMSVVGDAGLGLGLGAAHVAGYLDGDEDYPRQIAASALLGSCAGIGAGKMLAEMEPYTRDDAYVLRAAGLLGAYVPLAVVEIAAPDESKASTAAAMVGTVIGHGLGHYLVRGKDFRDGEGTLVTLGELAGGLVGLGIAHLAASENDDNDALYLSGSALGAAIGFWTTYRSYAPAAHTREERLSWTIDLAPEGLLALAGRAGAGADRGAPVPLLELSVRF